MDYGLTGGRVTEVSDNEAGHGLVPVGSGAELEQFEGALTTAMEVLGLPSTDVFIAFEQRYRVLANFGGALADLDAEHRARSLYLSKFMVAVGAGLFDAALNYLWDETISELRRRVVGYDLEYFFNIAVSSPDRRKQLKSEADLVRVDDFDLIRATNEIGLVSDVGYKQLDLIRYMRNFASAAHPNQNEIGPMQLLGWVETCIREVITLPESTVVAETKRLLYNVKTKKVTPEKAREVSNFFDDLRVDQADNLAAGLFGIYTSVDSSIPTRDNVRLLFPSLWNLLSESQKQQCGLKYGRFSANGDQDQADLARELLDAVDAVAYLPEPVRVSEIANAIDDLLVAHRGWDNFNTEPSRARLLERVVGDITVPAAVRSDYVLALIEVFLGNGHGVSWNAEPSYIKMIENFSSREAELALLSFNETRIASQLQHQLCRTKFGELLDLIEPKLARRRYKEIALAIRDFTGPLDGLARDSQMKRLIKALAD
jgi:hypothetical protein